jgi:uncharacterized protein (DUF302 family)
MEDNGIVHLASAHSVAETMSRLKAAVAAHGINILAHIDHSGDAARVGLKMRPTELLIFGNPKAGTPLMIASPTLALDLPLKALIWEDSAGKVWLTFNSFEYLQRRHNVPSDLMGNIAGSVNIFKQVTGDDGKGS